MLAKPMFEKMMRFIALSAIASGLSPSLALAQTMAPNAAPPPATGGVANGHKLQPEAQARPSQEAVRETLDGIDRLLKSDEEIAGRHSKVTIPHDLYGNDIGGNPGLEPIVDPALEK